MKTFREYTKEKEQLDERWKRAALMGTAATLAGAATAKMIGFPVAAGAAVAGAHYLLSRSGLRKDIRKKILKKRRLSEQKSLEQKTIKKYIKKKHKESNAKSAAMRKLYAKLGYKGNPGNYDLDESVREKAKRLIRAAKVGVTKDWKKKAATFIAPIPGSNVAAAVWAAKDAYDDYKQPA